MPIWVEADEYSWPLQRRLMGDWILNVLDEHFNTIAPKSQLLQVFIYV